MTVFEKIRTERKIDHKTMVEALGISKAYYSMLRSGDRPISKVIADRMNSVFGVPYEVSFCLTVHKTETVGCGGEKKKGD